MMPCSQCLDDPCSCVRGGRAQFERDTGLRARRTWDDRDDPVTVEVLPGELALIGALLSLSLSTDRDAKPLMVKLFDQIEANGYWVPGILGVDPRTGKIPVR